MGRSTTAVKTVDPTALHAQLVDYAEGDERSLNATIVRLLRKALEAHRVEVQLE